ncbi:unnamed protein product [Strongylus vulgaris]|uniref:Uncharacterized protein n=1 Tax=Strongylus vulgaris TaxID=40348 RepID=A0A3P7JR90_STRVU|nr:unnamed protein product [Strongylus vulgaris]
MSSGPTDPSSISASEIFHSNMSNIAADDPLAHSDPPQAPFTVVHPRNVHFLTPLKFSRKPNFHLRVNATLTTRLLTRRTTLKNTPKITINRTTASLGFFLSTSTRPPIVYPIVKEVSFYAPNEHRSILSLNQRETTGDSRATTRVARLAFHSDLDKQLAAVKRKKENREDIAYSNAVNHPVTIACMFIPLILL